HELDGVPRRPPAESPRRSRQRARARRRRLRARRRAAAPRRGARPRLRRPPRPRRSARPSLRAARPRREHALVRASVSGIGPLLSVAVLDAHVPRKPPQSRRRLDPAKRRTAVARPELAMTASSIAPQPDTKAVEDALAQIGCVPRTVELVSPLGARKG